MDKGAETKRVVEAVEEEVIELGAVTVETMGSGAFTEGDGDHPSYGLSDR